MTELKPCPFCGNQEAYCTSNCYGQNYVRCPNCGAVVWGSDDEHLTEKRAIELWNRRADNDRYIKLPCKVGDIVYYIFEGEIRELTVISLSYMFSENIKHFNLHTTNYRGAVLSYEIKDIGKTVFLTKVEAEAELKKRGDQNAR